ncbi:hypothetical protein LAZ67_11002252 [Cordylochernes scorpioides]|uniref:Ig-like domain-containing protein n=1 Tax=Cordylochernes scorpioides TaxID=51811 RepID=A0ABY6L300_9ARAC|nr:hypothetical protein LAZ67_11002252 [Cordylochernes scorpioides]
MPTKEPMKLMVRVRGDPEPTVDWLFNGQKIEPGLKYSMTRDGDRYTLTLPWPRAADSGTYECRASNPAGKDSCKASISVSDRAKRGEPPMFLKRLKNCDAIEGMPAKFTACITGTPTPDIKWYVSFLYLQETLDLLKLTFGNENVNKPTTFRWFSRFKNGMESVKDDKRVGHPIQHRNPEKSSQISNLIKENPQIGLRDIEKETGISKSLVGSIIKEDLQIKKTDSKFVPKMCTIQQKENRVEVAKKMLEMVEESPNWKEKVITGDETWVNGYDPETKRQSMEWKGKDEPRTKKS